MSGANTAEMDDWVHQALGVNPLDFVTAANDERPGSDGATGDDDLAPVLVSGASAPNPYADSGDAVIWQQGFEAGFAQPDQSHPAPAPYSNGAQTIYAEGVLAGQDAARQAAQQRAAPTPAPAPAGTSASAPQPTPEVPAASGYPAVANPYAATDLANVWQLGFQDGFAEPDTSHTAPAPYDNDARAVYAEGVLAGQDTARGLPNQSADTPASPSSDGQAAAAAPDSHVVQILKLAAGKVGGAAGAKLLELATPTSVAVMMGFIGLFVAAQWTPAGWAADGILVVTIVATAAMVGRELSGIIDDIRAFVRLANDPNGDVNEAADHLARAVAAIGVDVVLAILLHKAGSAAKPYLKPPTGFVDVVTPDGQIVRVPVDALPDNAMATKGGGEGKTGPTETKPTDTATSADPAGYQDALAKGDMKTAAQKLGHLKADAQVNALAKLKPAQLAQIHDAAVAEFGADSPQARMADPAHRANLEFDPDQKAPRPNERDTALRTEQKAGAKLERYKPEPGKKGDWVDTNGKVYDGCSPPPAKYFDAQMKSGGYEASLRAHLNHPNVNVVVVDVSELGLSPTQLQILDQLIERVAGANNPKILRIP